VQPSPWQELSNLAKYKQSEIKGKLNYINTEESLLKELKSGTDRFGDKLSKSRKIRVRKLLRKRRK
jgi:hypothetical protein